MPAVVDDCWKLSWTALHSFDSSASKTFISSNSLRHRSISVYRRLISASSFWFCWHSLAAAKIFILLFFSTDWSSACIARMEPCTSPLPPLSSQRPLDIPPPCYHRDAISPLYYFIPSSPWLQKIPKAYFSRQSLHRTKCIRSSLFLHAAPPHHSPPGALIPSHCAIVLVAALSIRKFHQRDPLNSLQLLIFQQ